MPATTEETRTGTDPVRMLADAISSISSKLSHRSAPRGLSAATTIPIGSAIFIFLALWNASGKLDERIDTKVGGVETQVKAVSTKIDAVTTLQTTMQGDAKVQASQLSEARADVKDLANEVQGLRDEFNKRLSFLEGTRAGDKDGGK